MSKKIWLMVGLFLLTACTINTSAVIESTEFTPANTLEVAKTIFPISTSTPKVIRSSSTSMPSELAEMDLAYFDGIIMITQYYTYLDKGLFEDAFNLFSTKKQKNQSMEEYVKMAALAFKKVKIKTIQPYFNFALQQGRKVTPEMGEERKFFIRIIAEGEGGMSGSYPNGVVQSFFITLIQENSEWKIDDFGN